MSEWEVDEHMPRFDDMREFQVWMGDGSVRRVRRVGNRSTWISPGVLIFTDSNHPLGNLLCDESNVTGWRYTGQPAPELPRDPYVPRPLDFLVELFGHCPQRR